MTTTSHHPTGARRATVADLVDRLASVPGREDRLRHLEVLPPRAARHADWPDWADPQVVAALEARGITRPWWHQVAAAETAHEGGHVVLATGTASGKSLGYQLPALSDVRAARRPRGQRGATVLYLAPTKALAHDQLAGLSALGLDVRATTHDGDSSREQRDWARDHAEYLLTNPDMLHRSLLPSHARWASFLGSLRYVVVDECHHYRGVFGAHVSHVLRRLRRICASYGAFPTFVLASATVAEPATAAHRLTGLDVQAITDDASPRGQVALGLWEPPFTAGEHGAPVPGGGPPPRRPPTSSPTWSPRTCAPSPSSAPVAAPSRSRSPPPSCSPRSTPPSPSWSRPTGAATCPRSDGRSRSPCAAAS